MENHAEEGQRWHRCIQNMRMRGSNTVAGAATLLLGIPAGLLLCEAKASAVANRAPIPLGG